MVVNYNGTDNTPRQRQNANGNPTKFVVTEAGKEADKRLDRHERLAMARFGFCCQQLIVFLAMNLVDHLACLPL